MTHTLQTSIAYPLRSYDFCTRCGIKVNRWYKDGKWHSRVRGPKECHG